MRPARPALTDSLTAQAEAAEKAGHTRTAGQPNARATNYLCQAELMQSAQAPDRSAPTGGSSSCS